LRDVGTPLEGKIMETPGHIAGSISARLDDGTCRVGDATENLFQQKK
jgi:glyoxylase-like metal-dependent hydrolase (beta-lactamase superfamily II)